MSKLQLFRRVPTLEATDQTIFPSPSDYPASREHTCEEEKGHILKLEDGEIVCAACGASWRDRGF